MLKQIVLFWLMIHLANTPSVLDKKLTSNVNSLDDQFFIAHSRNYHNMTAEEEMGEEELE